VGEEKIKKICVDEKSYLKGHEYVTVLSEAESGRVLDVSQNRNIQSIDRVLNNVLSKETLEKMEAVCCDM